MKRLIERDKGKAHILQMMCRDFFSKHDVSKAIVSISEDKLTRTGAQNKLLWLWYSVIEKETGQPAKDYVEDGVHKKGLHSQFKRSILPLVKYDDGDTKVPTTKTLKVKEFTEYLERIDREMVEFGLLLPRPSDVYWLAMGIKAP